MTTHYHLEKGICSQLKNILQTKINEYFTELSGTLIVVDDLAELLEIIKEKVSQINSLYKRCKPVEISYHFSGKVGNIYVGGIDSLTFIIKSVELKSVQSLQ